MHVSAHDLSSILTSFCYFISNQNMRIKFVTKIETLTLVAIVSFSSAACRNGEESSTKSIFGGLNGHFITKENQNTLPISRNVGALYARSAKDMVQFCTAFNIEGDKIITNKHCFDAISFIDKFFDKKDYSFYFSRNLIAKLTDSNQMNFVFTENGEIQPFFVGEVEEDGQDDETLVDFRNPLHLSDDLFDVGLFRLSRSFGDPVKVELGDSTREVLLISYPGSLPKFVSNHCQILSESDSEVTHDCDSLPGSSGGLIVDAVSQKPIAIHKSGLPTSWPLIGEGELYKKDQRFKTRSEATEAYCRSRPFLPADCPQKMLPLAANIATKLNSLFFKVILIYLRSKTCLSKILKAV